MFIMARIYSALKAAIIHLGLSVLVTAISATLVFGLWYPSPYRYISGGTELFWLVVGVDVVCGPLLTLVIFNPAKSRTELLRDLGLVVLIQSAALVYGLWTVWQARPLYLVNEIDRFKVISAPNINRQDLARLPKLLQVGVTSGPLVVAIREPKDAEERKKVMFESVNGGRDYAERPEFYLPYDEANALKSLKRARPLAVFLQKQPTQLVAATELAKQKNADMAQWMYLPVVARQDWVAVLDKQGQIQGFLRGDGF